MTVEEVIRKLRTMPPKHDVFVMDMPPAGDMQYKIQDIQEWDGCVTIVIDIENEDSMGYDKAARNKMDDERELTLEQEDKLDSYAHRENLEDE